MKLATQERDTYEQMWALPGYAAHSPGEEMAPIFRAIVERFDGARHWHASSVLDAGTGSGKGAVALAAAGFHVTLCDLTADGLVPEAQRFPFHRAVLWEDVRRTVGAHDYVYCCDVLEHIPPTFTMLTVSRLLSVARHGLFLSIGLTPDTWGHWVGTALHQSVQSFVQWRDQLAALGEVVEARDLLTRGVYFVRPPC